MRHLITALLSFTLLASGLAGAAETGTLSGQFKIDGDTPMAGGMVYFYNLVTGPAPSHDRYWRVPDHVDKLDKDGRFSVNLTPGEYCVGAVKRRGPSVNQIGPPSEGDFFIMGLDEQKAAGRYKLTAGEKRDIGAIVGAVPYKPVPVREGLTLIQGKVTDPAGKPVAGAMVFAFVTPTIVGKPLFVSDRSGSDGTFTLRVSQGGTYYLKVRNSYGGGPPKGGAVLDGNREEPLAKVTVSTGQTAKGIAIVGKTFPGRGPNKE